MNLLPDLDISYHYGSSPLKELENNIRPILGAFNSPLWILMEDVYGGCIEKLLFMILIDNNENTNRLKNLLFINLYAFKHKHTDISMHFPYNFVLEVDDSLLKSVLTRDLNLFW